MTLCPAGGNGPTEAGPGDGSGVAGPDELDVRVPEIDTQYGEKLWRQKRAILIDQAMCVYIQLAMRDRSGQNIDLTHYGFSGSESSSSSSASTTTTLGARWRESSLVDKDLYQTTPTVIDAEAGIIKSIVPSQIADKTGIYLAQFALLNDEDCPFFMDDCYVYNQHSAWYDTSETTTQVGPPLVDDVRLSLRDSDPQLNELISEYDFDLGEIAYAATRTIQYWNDQPPTITRAQYSTKTFPFRDIWLEGIQLYLFELAEEHYRRNFFRVTAGGTVTDDKNKHREYNAAWKERFARFKELVMHRKAQINIAGAWATLGAGYPVRYYG